MNIGYDSVVWVPEDKRDENYVKQVSNSLIMNTEKRTDDVSVVHACRAMYTKGKYSDSYDHLYQSVTKKITDECDVEKTITLVPPARVRHIPIITPMIRRLVAGEKDRPDVSIAYTTDAINSQRKEDAYIADLNMRQELLEQEKLDAFKLQSMLLETRQQVLQQMPVEDPEMKVMLQQLDMEIQRTRTVLQRSMQFTESEMRKIQHYWKYEHKDLQELFAEQVVSFLKVHKRLPHIFNRNFEEFLVTGKQQYLVDWEPGMEDPMVEQVFYEDLSVPYNEYVNFIHEHSWGVVRQYMSLDNIVSTMGNFLTRDMMDRLRSGGGMFDVRRDNFLTTPDGRVLPGFIMERQSQGGQTSSSLYTTYKTYFKLDTEVNVLYSANKHREDADPHVKVLDEDEFEWYKAKPERLGENKKLEKRYKQILYRSTRIGEDVWLNAGKHPVQLRTEDHKSRISLPIIGHAEHYFYHNSSMIWETKDVQELYNILFYQKELLIVLAGVRGVIVDLSQKPDGMELPELIYYMRQGIMPIQTLDDDGSQRNGQFNQFGTFDQTISPGIQYIDSTLMMLKQLANEITGVSDALMGVVRPTDQVGTTQLSYQNSSLATEKYYQEHEVLKEQVLTRAVNLAQYAYKEGKKANFIAGDKTLQRLQLPKNAMDGVFKVVMKNGRREAMLMQEVQNLTRDQYRAGKVKATQLISSLGVDSFTQMRKMLQEYEDVAIEQNEAMRNADAQRMQQVEEKKAQMQAQIEQMMIEHKERMGQMQAQIEKAKLDMAKQKLMAETQVDMAINERKAQSQDYQTDTEAAVEREYLEFNKLELAVNSRNQQAAMLIDSVHKQLDARKKEKVKD